MTEMEGKGGDGEEFPREVSRLFDYGSASRDRREEGTVVEAGGGTAQVMMRRSRLCEGCGSCCVMVGDDAMLAEADNAVGAKKGDRVVVDLPVRLSIKAAWILYGLPLLAFLGGLGAGALVGSALGWGFNVPLALACAVALTILSFVLLSRVYATGTRASQRYRLTITKILK